MVIDPQTVIALGVTSVAVIGWVVHMESRLRVVERASRASDAHQRIIITGLVRMGVLVQEEVDAMQDRLEDAESRGRGERN